jgi:hypothetical protein
MGMLTGGVGVKGKTPDINLTGATGINDDDTSAPFDARAGIKIYADGTIDKYKHQTPGAGYTQLSSSTDWCIPNKDASIRFEVKLDVVSGTPDIGDTTGVWHNLSIDREWIITSTTDPEINIWEWTLSIRYNGGPTLASATYEGITSSGL